MFYKFWNLDLIMHIKNKSLFWTGVVSLIGILFSGFLSYKELIMEASCSFGQCTTIGTMPACVYGLVVFLIIFVISVLGLFKKTESDFSM